MSYNIPVYCYNIPIFQVTQKSQLIDENTFKKYLRTIRGCFR